MENIKKLQKNKKFKMPGLTLNHKIELPDESYTLSNVQDYFQLIKNMKQ